MQGNLQGTGSPPQVCLLSLKRMQARPAGAFQPAASFLQGHQSRELDIYKCLTEENKHEWEDKLSQPTAMVTSASWPVAVPAKAARLLDHSQQN